jgi:alginate O-acetyltransferase complex protein AlgI
VFELGPTFLVPTSLAFIGAVLLLAAVHWLALPPRARAPALLLVSLAYAYLLISWRLLLILALILFVHHRATRAASHPGTRLAWTLGLVLGIFAGLKSLLLVVSLVLGQVPLYVPIAEVSATAVVLPMGISYCLFRLIHYAVEVHRKRLSPGPLHRLMLFVIWFPTFRAGPIDRLNRFRPAERLTLKDVNAALFRIISGLVKKILLADLGMVSYLTPLLLAHPLPAPLQQLVTAYVLTLLVYLDFSGYSDLAIGTSRLFGYRILENFDYPLHRRTIAEFWRHWHISLYLFIRDYFYFPIFGRATSFKKMLLGLFLAQVLSQIWHAFSLNFLLLGCYHGSFMVLWGFYDRWRRKRSLRSWGWAGRVLWTLLTFHIVAVGFLLFFWGRLPASHG